MKNLLELLDDQAINNVLSTETFSPERTIFLCERGASRSEKASRLRRYFRYRGFPEPIFQQINGGNAVDLQAQLLKITRKFPDSVLDVTGGSDRLLFAAGMFCAQHKLPVIAYDVHNKVFRSVHQAEDYENTPCQLRLSVEDCLVLSGGAQIAHARGAAAQSGPLYHEIDAVWRVYAAHQKNWNRHVRYLQAAGVGADGVSVSAPAQIEGVRANVGLLEALGREGLLRDLEIADQRICFRYKDQLTRRALNDVGQCLELYVYKTARDMAFFDDVQMSALVDWNGVTDERNNLYNEIDVIAVRDVRPIFISCKTCAPSTSALNELKVLTHRFGGRSARAMLVTMDLPQNRMPTLMKRAAELNMLIVDQKDLLRGELPQILRRALE